MGGPGAYDSRGCDLHAWLCIERCKTPASVRLSCPDSVHNVHWANNAKYVIEHSRQLPP